MRGLLLRWLLAALALYITASLASSYVHLEGAPWALLVVALLSLLNAAVKPFLFLVKLVTLPINLLTLGVFSFSLSLAVNVFFFYLLGHVLHRWLYGFEVEGLAGAVVGGVLMSVINMFFSILVRESE